MEFSTAYSNNNYACDASTVSHSPSHSHRRRRLGAAKDRLTKAREAAKNGPIIGWHESMEAASLAAQHDWGRETGWKDYIEQGYGESEITERKPAEKIRIPIHVATLKHNQHVSSSIKRNGRSACFPVGRVEPFLTCLPTQSNDDEFKAHVVNTAKTPTAPKTQSQIPARNKHKPVPQDRPRDDESDTAPVPPAIKRITRTNTERSSLSIQTTRSEDRRYPRMGHASQRPNPTFTKHPAIRNTVGSPSHSVTRSNQWVSSMIAATSKLSEHGHSWSPKNGFTHLDTSDVVSLRSVATVQITRTQQPQPQRQQNQKQKQQTSTSHIQSPFAAPQNLVVDHGKGDPPGMSAEEISHFDPSAMFDQACRVNREGAINVSHIMQKIDDAIQAHENKILALNLEENEDYLLLQPAPKCMPNVDVRNEDVRQVELGLFSESTRNSPCRVPLLSSCGGMNQILSASPGTHSGGHFSQESDSVSFISRSDLEKDTSTQGTEFPSKRHNQRVSTTMLNRHAPGAEMDSALPFDPMKLPIRRRSECLKSTTDDTVLTDEAGPSTARGNTSSELKTTDSAEPGNQSGVNNSRLHEDGAGSSFDDHSHISVESSVTAGWKSFLAKKVKAEIEVELRQRNQPEHESKDAIKKTVSFATDSLGLSDSFVDTLFDFPASDIDDSPVRRKGRPLHSPQKLTASRSRLAVPQHRERIFSHDNVNQSLTSHDVSSVELNNLREYSLKQRGMSKKHTEESITEAAEQLGTAAPSFLQRLAECRSANAACTSQRNQGTQNNVSDHWYTQRRQASRIVEDILNSLRSQQHMPKCISGRDNNSDSHANTSIYTESTDSERDAHELARARVDAMVETLYYDDSPKHD